jgi:DNA-binding IclR family transcriptional regulator
MNSNRRAFSLAKSEAACLEALRAGESSPPSIAQGLGLPLQTASAALLALERRGLAERRPGESWAVTANGASWAPDAAAERPEPSADHFPQGRRLLDALERPMLGRDIGARLAVSRQRAGQILDRLLYQGRVRLGDPADRSWWVLRADDDTRLISQIEERVLSALPGDHATTVPRLRARARLPNDRLEETLRKLVEAGLAEPAGEYGGRALYRATAAGVAHPQNRGDLLVAAPPHLPVRSNRVRSVLSAIDRAGAMRILEIRDALHLPQQVINSGMQYLKRKGLVRKAGEYFDDPYVLTDFGRVTLAELERPGQMRFGLERSEPLPRPAAGGRAGVARRPKPPAQPGTAPARSARTPGLPVRSDRVQSVMSVVAEAGAIHVRDISDTLGLPRQSVNALMQYLKRKALVEQTGEKAGSPYALTETGRTTLSRMTERRAA